MNVSPGHVIDISASVAEDTPAGDGVVPPVGATVKGTAGLIVKFAFSVQPNNWSVATTSYAPGRRFEIFITLFV